MGGKEKEREVLQVVTKNAILNQSERIFLPTWRGGIIMLWQRCQLYAVHSHNKYTGMYVFNETGGCIYQEDK